MAKMRRRDAGWVLPIALALGVGFVGEKILYLGWAGSWAYYGTLILVALIMKKLWYFE